MTSRRDDRDHVDCIVREPRHFCVAFGVVNGGLSCVLPFQQRPRPPGCSCLVWPYSASRMPICAWRGNSGTSLTDTAPPEQDQSQPTPAMAASLAQLQQQVLQLRDEVAARRDEAEQARQALAAAQAQRESAERPKRNGSPGKRQRIGRRRNNRRRSACPGRGVRLFLLRNGKTPRPPRLLSSQNGRPRPSAANRRLRRSGVPRQSPRPPRPGRRRDRRRTMHSPCLRGCGKRRPPSHRRRIRRLRPSVSTAGRRRHCGG